jgi:hypothetical protein
VVLDQAALEKEKQRLLDDNAKLKYVLKQYLDRITVNAKVLKDPKNPLLVRQGSWLLPGTLKRGRKTRMLVGPLRVWSTNVLAGGIRVKWTVAQLTFGVSEAHNLQSHLYSHL